MGREARPLANSHQGTPAFHTHGGDGQHLEGQDSPDVDWLLSSKERRQSGQKTGREEGRSRNHPQEWIGTISCNYFQRFRQRPFLSSADRRE